MNGTHRIEDAPVDDPVHTRFTDLRDWLPGIAEAGATVASEAMPPLEDASPEDAEARSHAVAIGESVARLTEAAALPHLAAATAVAPTDILR